MGDGGNRIRGGDEMRIVGRDCEESSNACESYGLYTTCEEDIYQVTRYELYGAKKKKREEWKDTDKGESSEYCNSVLPPAQEKGD